MALYWLTLFIGSVYMHCVYCKPSISEQLHNVTLYEGQNTTFTCTLEFPDDKLTHVDMAWKNDEAWIAIKSIMYLNISRPTYHVSTRQARRDDGMLVIHNTLTMTDVTLDDAGLITCFLIHQQHVGSSALLTVLKKILPTPLCNIPKHIKLGDQTTVKCETKTGDPPIRFSMYLLSSTTRKRELIKETSQHTLHSYGHMLRLNHTISRENIAKLFVCEVTFISELRDVRSCTSDLLSAMICTQRRHVEVQVIPLNTGPIYAGYDACFMCNVVYEIVDSDIISWTLSGRPEFVSNVSSHQHCFREIQQIDNGMIVTCNISNKHFTGHGSTVVEVVEGHESGISPTDDVITDTFDLPTPNLSVNRPMPDTGEYDSVTTKACYEEKLSQLKMLLSVSLIFVACLISIVAYLCVRYRRALRHIIRIKERDGFSAVTYIEHQVHGSVDHKIDPCDRNSDQQFPLRRKTSTNSNDDEIYN